MTNSLIANTLGVVSREIAIGVSPLRLNGIAEKYVKNNGGKPGFLGYDGFQNVLRVFINKQMIHEIPSNYKLRQGDVVSCECGVLMNGFYARSSYTFTVGTVSAETQQLLKITKEALFLGIEQAVDGNHLGDIGFAIQKHAEKNALTVVGKMVGQGIGRNLHEDPQVLIYGKSGRGLKLREGLVLAIEPMLSLGKSDFYQDCDGCGIVTAEGKTTAHFGHTVVVRKGKAQILSNFEFIEDTN